MATRTDVRLLPRDADRRPDVGLLRPGLAVTGALAVVAVFWLSRQMQEVEAAVTAALARGTGLDDAVRYGTAVVFTVAGRTTGVEITVGCSAALLAAPFLAVTTALLAVRRVSVARAVQALAVALTTLLVVNQVRMLAIIAGMEAWGPEVGYSRTHVLIGTALSTVGVVLAGSCYLGLLLRGSYPSPRSTAGDVHGEVP